MNEEKSLRDEIAEVKRLVNDIAQRMNDIINNHVENNILRQKQQFLK